jgi:hypothetical protein
MQLLHSRPTVSASELVRFRGNRGGIIPMHRALARLRFGTAEMLSSVVTAALISCAWILCLPSLCLFWRRLFILGLRFLPLQCEVRTSLPSSLSLVVAAQVPYFVFDPIMPSSTLWAATCVAVIAIFAITFFLPPEFIPIAYLLRCLLFVQASALVYFAVLPAQFPYAPADYLQGFLLSGAALIGLVPVLFLLTYYIFPFSFIKKVLLTVLTMGYLTIFLPFQVMLHALLLRKSILFMPLLYLVLGMPLDVLIIVALYAWGMTWEFSDSQVIRQASLSS